MNIQGGPYGEDCFFWHRNLSFRSAAKLLTNIFSQLDGPPCMLVPQMGLTQCLKLLLQNIADNLLPHPVCSSHKVTCIYKLLLVLLAHFFARSLLILRAFCTVDGVTGLTEFPALATFFSLFNGAILKLRYCSVDMSDQWLIDNGTVCDNSIHLMYSPLNYEEICGSLVL